MTNAEKFKMVFGGELDFASGLCDISTCDTCVFSNDNAKVCREKAAKFWSEEYVDKFIGYWVHWTDDRKDYCSCSECGYGDEGEVLLDNRTPFCPVCGTKMAGFREGNNEKL